MRFVVPICALVVGLVGCGAIRPMSAYLERAPDAQTVQASGRTLNSGALVDETFELGGYQVEVTRSWPWWSMWLWGPPRLFREANFDFALTRGAEVITGHCTARGFKAPATRRQLTCSCRDPANEVASLELDGPLRALPLTGTATIAAQAYPVRSYGEPQATHYDLRDAFTVGEPPVLAVGLALPGEVWLRPPLSDEVRPAALCLASALMLYRRRHAHFDGSMRGYRSPDFDGW